MNGKAQVKNQRRELMAKKNKIKKTVNLTKGKAPKALEKTVAKSPKTKTIRVNSKTILRKKDGEYVLRKWDLDMLMMALVHQVESVRKSKQKPVSLTTPRSPDKSKLEIKDFNINITYTYDGKVEMREWTDGSHRRSWARKDDKPCL